MNTDAGRLRFRSVFISDTHLGTRGARVASLAAFLRAVQSDHLYLVGDIVDGWRLRKSWYWDKAHDEVLRLLLRRSREGTEVTYVPGNHDEALRHFLPIGFEIAGIRMANEATHTTAAGLRLLVTHGDQFDSVVCNYRLLAILGDNAYTFALLLNRIWSAARHRLGYPYWSLSNWLKRQVKGAVAAIDRFEDTLAFHAKSRGFDGVVCGHIHYAQMREIGGVLYLNDGDWVESCTALVEHMDGRLELLDWTMMERELAERREQAAKTPTQIPAQLPAQLPAAGSEPGPAVQPA